MISEVGGSTLYQFYTQVDGCCSALYDKTNRWCGFFNPFSAMKCTKGVLAIMVLVLDTNGM